MMNKSIILFWIINTTFLIFAGGKNGKLKRRFNQLPVTQSNNDNNSYEALGKLEFLLSLPADIALEIVTQYCFNDLEYRENFIKGGQGNFEIVESNRIEEKKSHFQISY